MTVQGVSHFHQQAQEKAAAAPQTGARTAHSRGEQWALLLLFVCLAVGGALRIWKFGYYPAGFNMDESGSIYDAWSLAHYGVDRWRIPYPIYFNNYRTGQSGLIIYCIMFWFKLFGYNPVTMRLPALINSFVLALSGVGLFGTVWENRYGIRNIYAQAAYAFLWMIAPYTMLEARFSLDCNLLNGTIMLTLFLLCLSMKTKKTWLFVLSGVCAGISLYCYAVNYMMMPIFLVICLLYLLRVKAITGRQILAVAIPVFILAFPLMCEEGINIIGAKPFRLGLFSITIVPDYRIGEVTIDNIPENFLLTLKSALMYDGIDYNSIPEYWNFYPVTVPFVAVGAIVMIRRFVSDWKERAWRSDLPVLFWFFASLIVGSCLGHHGESGKNPNVNKINGIFPAIMFLAVVGFLWCVSKLRKVQWKRVFIIAVTGIYLCWGVSFFHYYFTDYQPTNLWGYYFPEALSYIQSDEKISKKPLLMENEYIFYLNSALPSPYDFDVENNDFPGTIFVDRNHLLEAVQTDYGFGVNYLLLHRVITDELRQAFQDLGYQSKEFGEYTLYYYE